MSIATTPDRLNPGGGRDFSRGDHLRDRIGTTNGAHADRQLYLAVLFARDRRAQRLVLHSVGLLTSGFDRTGVHCFMVSALDRLCSRGLDYARESRLTADSGYPQPKYIRLKRLVRR